MRRLRKYYAVIELLMQLETVVRDFRNTFRKVAMSEVAILLSNVESASF